ncbi:hypothetical protein WA016_03282 [Myxococcus stipitatus]
MRPHDAGFADTDGASRMRMHWTLQPDAFRSARTAVEVRRALVATAPGKWAIRGHWVTAVILLLVALTGTGIGWFVAFIAGNLSYMAVRDFTALPTLRHLASGSASPAAEPR